MSIYDCLNLIRFVFIREKARAEHRAAMEAQAIRDRMEDRKKYLQRKEEKRQFDEEIKKWEMINRFKTAEAMKEYNEKNRREKWQKILEYRKELLNQMVLLITEYILKSISTCSLFAFVNLLILDI